MATKLICDGCDAESPNADGLHVANHWVKVSAAWTSRLIIGWQRQEDFIFCLDCVRRALGAMSGETATDYYEEVGREMAKGRGR